MKQRKLVNAAPSVRIVTASFRKLQRLKRMRHVLRIRQSTKWKTEMNEEGFPRREKPGRKCLLIRIECERRNSSMLGLRPGEMTNGRQLRVVEGGLESGL